MAQELTKHEDLTAVAVELGERWGIPAQSIGHTLKTSVFACDPPLSNSELAGALVICAKYDLNPFTKQIYVTRSSGKLITIVPIDGWTAIANREKLYDGVEFEYGPEDEKGHCQWVECSIFVKGRSRPTKVRERMKECIRDSGPWRSHPNRMLRHKAFIQAARLAFSLSGIMDPDEAEEVQEADVISIRGGSSQGRKPGYVLAIPEERPLEKNRQLEADLREAYERPGPAPEPVKRPRGRPPRMRAPEPEPEPNPEVHEREPGDDSEEIAQEPQTQPRLHSLRDRALALSERGIQVRPPMDFDPTDIEHVIRYEQSIKEAELQLARTP